MADPFESMQDAISSLQKSSMRSLPVFLIGIIATLVAAAIAIYFIVTLSTDLKEARVSLRQSQEALSEARRSLASVNVTLRQSQVAATAPGNAARIADAIAEVSASQKELTSASSSLTQATSKLPSSAPDKLANLSGSWTDEYGTIYEVRHSGASFGYRATFKNAAALGPGAGQGEARGTAKGSQLSYVYSDRAGHRYQCQGKLSSDNQRIEESCRPPGGQPLKVTLIRS